MPKKSSSRPTTTPSHSTTVPNRDILHRLNFLHQAAHYLAITLDDSLAPAHHQHPGPSSTSAPRSESLTPQIPLSTCFDQSSTINPSSHSRPPKQIKLKSSNRAKRNNKKFKRAKMDAQDQNLNPMPNLPMVGLSRTLSKTIKVVAKKAVVRMDPSVKRSICRSCSLLLIPGHTASSRLLKSGPHAHKVTTTCLACNHKRTIPHPPEISQDTHQRSDGSITAAFSEKRMKRDERLKRPMAFWKRNDHVVFAGTEKVAGGSGA